MMKLARLESTTQHLSRESVERLGQADAHQVRRVEALEAIGGDRERSLQQEVAEIEPTAIGAFEGAQQVLLGARQIAQELSSLSDNARGLVNLRSLSQHLIRVDDKA